jgi:hypothetical protein
MTALQIVRGSVQYALADPARLDFLAYGLQAFSSKLGPEDAEVVVAEVRAGFRQLLRKEGEEGEGQGQEGDKYESLHVYLRGLEVGSWCSGWWWPACPPAFVCGFGGGAVAVPLWRACGVLGVRFDQPHHGCHHSWTAEGGPGGWLRACDVSICWLLPRA